LFNDAEIVFDDGEELLLGQLDIVDGLHLLCHVFDSRVVWQDAIALDLLHELSFVHHVRILIFRVQEYFQENLIVSCLVVFLLLLLEICEDGGSALDLRLLTFLDLFRG
jgi:hypothetical protein